MAGGLINTARALAIDLAPLRVNCIAPGLIQTELIEVSSSRYKHETVDCSSQLQSFPPNVKETIIQKTLAQPVPHIGTPDEAGEAYAFAMKCSYLTGQTMIVDGGVTLV